jgi:hypothetical protein
LKIELLTSNNFERGIPFEDEVLVPEAAKPNNLHVPQYITKIPNPTKPGAYLRNPEVTEAKGDDSRMLR